jgi:hypothetical protein
MPDMMFGPPRTTVLPSNIKVIETEAPAAGAESITVIPAGKAWRVMSFIATLTADATVANRLPSLVIDDGTNVLVRVFASTNVTAAQSVLFSAITAGVNSSGLAGVGLGSVPLLDPMFLVLQPGWRIRTLTTAIVAGDQWGIARLVVDEIANVTLT